MDKLLEGAWWLGAGDSIAPDGVRQRVKIMLPVFN